TNSITDEMVYMIGVEVKPAQQWSEEPRSKVETGRQPDLEIEKDQHCFIHRIPMFSSPLQYHALSPTSSPSPPPLRFSIPRRTDRGR
ncbi:hypothetical protein BDN71DRAFT_1454750, partial [Pleurotus eryngii]